MGGREGAGLPGSVSSTSVNNRKIIIRSEREVILGEMQCVLIMRDVD